MQELLCRSANSSFVNVHDIGKWELMALGAQSGPGPIFCNLSSGPGSRAPGLPELADRTPGFQRIKTFEVLLHKVNLIFYRTYLYGNSLFHSHTVIWPASTAIFRPMSKISETFDHNN